MMRKYLLKGYLLSGSTFGEEDMVEGDFVINKKRHVDQMGLLRAHSYTILRIEEIDGGFLINLRNPWSSISRINQSSAWNEKSPLWTPKLKLILQPHFDESNFWLSHTEFIQYFRSINLCMLDNFHEIRLRGKFIRIEELDDQSDNSMVLSRWHYKIEIKQPTHLVIGLH